MAARPYFLLSAATTNFTNLGNANLVGGSILNTNAASRYVKFYKSTDAKGTAPTVGTTVPFLTVLCAASVATPLGPLLPTSQGLSSSGELWMATTTGVAATDTAAVGAGDLYIHLAFEG